MSATKIGRTAGAGLETRLASNWSVKAEYLYVNLGSISVTGLIGNVSVSDHIGRVGLNYHF